MTQPRNEPFTGTQAPATKTVGSKRAPLSPSALPTAVSSPAVVQSGKKKQRKGERPLPKLHMSGPDSDAEEPDSKDSYAGDTKAKTFNPSLRATIGDLNVANGGALNVVIANAPVNTGAISIATNPNADTKHVSQPTTAQQPHLPSPVQQRQWAPQQNQNADLYSVGGARGVCFRAAATAPRPDRALLPLALEVWSATQPTTIPAIAKVFAAMTGYAFPTAHASVVGSVTIRKEPLRGRSETTKIASILGSKDKAEVIARAGYNGEALVVFADTTPIPPTATIGSYQWPGSHPEKVLETAKKSLAQLSALRDVGMAKTSHAQASAPALSLVDDARPPLVTYSSAPTTFSPTAVLLQAYAAAITSATPRITFQHGTLSLRKGLVDDSMVKDLLKRAPTITIGLLDGFPKELLWAAPGSEELDKNICELTEEYDVSVRARKQQCRRCLGPFHPQNRSCTKRCSRCSGSACPAADGGSCSSLPRCTFCTDKTADHKLSDCPLARGTRFDLQKGELSSNLQLMRRAAVLSGIGGSYVRKARTLKLADRTFEEAAHAFPKGPQRSKDGAEAMRTVALADVVIYGAVATANAYRNGPAGQRLRLTEALMRATIKTEELRVAAAGREENELAKEEAKLRALEAELEKAKADLAKRRADLSENLKMKIDGVAAATVNLQDVYSESTFPEVEPKEMDRVLEKSKAIPPSNLGTAVSTVVRALASPEGGAASDVKATEEGAQPPVGVNVVKPTHPVSSAQWTAQPPHAMRVEADPPPSRQPLT